LTPTALKNIETRNRMLRLDLEASVRDESGNWIGAIWPTGISLLFPNEIWGATAPDFRSTTGRLKRTDFGR
jgi:hypothetical protein